MPNLLKTKYHLHFCKKIYVLVKLPATSSRNALVHDFSLLHHRTSTTTHRQTFIGNSPLWRQGKKFLMVVTPRLNGFFRKKMNKITKRKLFDPKLNVPTNETKNSRCRYCFLSSTWCTCTTVHIFDLEC